MPVRLGDDDFRELIGEADPFKLAVLGVAAIEAEFDAAIADAFGGDVPAELRTARWGIKLALVVALGLLPQRFTGIFERLATLRNRFSHGEIHTLTRQHARTLGQAIRSAFPAVPAEAGDELAEHLESASPVQSLKVALLMARETSAATAGAARVRREEERQIVLVQRTLRNRPNALLRALTEEAREPDEP